YWFDSNAMLHGMTCAAEWKVGLLVDEAHNLVDRARAMYSVELVHADLQRVVGSAPQAVRNALARLDRAWSDFETLQSMRDEKIADARDSPSFAEGFDSTRVTSGRT